MQIEKEFKKFAVEGRVTNVYKILSHAGFTLLEHLDDETSYSLQEVFDIAANEKTCVVVTSEMLFDAFSEFDLQRTGELTHETLWEILAGLPACMQDEVFSVGKKHNIFSLVNELMLT